MSKIKDQKRLFQVQFIRELASQAKLKHPAVMTAISLLAHNEPSGAY